MTAYIMTSQLLPLPRSQTTPPSPQTSAVGVGTVTRVDGSFFRLSSYPGDNTINMKHILTGKCHVLPRKGDRRHHCFISCNMIFDYFT